MGLRESVNSHKGLQNMVPLFIYLCVRQGLGKGLCTAFIRFSKGFFFVNSMYYFCTSEFLSFPTTVCWWFQLLLESWPLCLPLHHNFSTSTLTAAVFFLFRWPVQIPSIKHLIVTSLPSLDRVFQTRRPCGPLTTQCNSWSDPP